MDGRRTPPETSNFYCLPGRAGGFRILEFWPLKAAGGVADAAPGSVGH
jgi:hypothetical protein